MLCVHVCAGCGKGRYLLRMFSLIKVEGVCLSNRIWGYSFCKFHPLNTMVNIKGVWNPAE